MSENFTPLLTTHNWNEEWKELQKARRHADDSSYWDKRAKTFGSTDSPNPYADRFLELACIKPQETVLDMGCGTGALSVPLGLAGHEVIAADFSQGMLDMLGEQLVAHHITTVQTKRMSWSDNWEEYGLGANAVDICLASRSIATADLKDSLMRLNHVARRRVGITLATGVSPRSDERILQALGLPCTHGRDYLYAFNILAGEGLNPEVSYIESIRNDSYDSIEEAYDELGRMVIDATVACDNPTEQTAALNRLHTWLTDNIVENERYGKSSHSKEEEKRLRLRNPRKITWAFIAWNTQ